MGNLFLHNDHLKNKQLVTLWQGWMGVKQRQKLWASGGFVGCDRGPNRDVVWASW